MVDITSKKAYRTGMAKRRIRLSDQVRRAVAECGQTCYRISKETGIDPATLSRFMSHERGLPMKTLDRLADHLDLNIVAGRGRQRGGDRGKS